jgi:hypothetical protein
VTLTPGHSEKIFLKNVGLAVSKDINNITRAVLTRTRGIFFAKILTWNQNDGILQKKIFRSKPYGIIMMAFLEK